MSYDPSDYPHGFLLLTDVVKKTRLSRSFIYMEMDAGRLRARKAGRRLLFAPLDVEDWFNSLPMRESREPLHLGGE